jgi:F-type H+-transporting ATPase subunit epsilon
MAQRLTLQVEVVTTTGRIFEGEADEVVAPGSEGQLGILPRHAPLMTTLKIGALHIKLNGAEETLYVGGGFMEVAHQHVIVLADDAERGADIDEAHAQEARRRAQQALEQATGDVDRAALEGALEVAIQRLHVAEISRTRHRRRELPGQG